VVLQWGATGEEVRTDLPGDKLVADADLASREGGTFDPGGFEVGTSA